MQHAPRLVGKSDQEKGAGSGFGWSSGNWSGYVKTGTRGTFRSVGGEWTVPRLTRGGKNAYSSIWIGIDGFTNQSLIQAGTEQDVVDGSGVYYAWWEILPAAETRISRPVAPGDRIQALIRHIGKRRWLIQLKNLTRRWTFRKVLSYKGPQTSAEWIVERPQVNGRITTLARYGHVAMTRCLANGRNPRLKKANGGVMTQNGAAISVPGQPNASGNGFSVWYGAGKRAAVRTRRPTLRSYTRRRPRRQ